jgi:glutamate racemase
MTPGSAPTPVARTARIGVFDSGVGGLSVLRALHAHLPAAQMHYVADSGHAPYGERSDRHVLTRSRRIAEHLFGQGSQVLVIACNTATAVAAATLRDAWPGHPIVGVEPGLKPALALTRNGRIGVMATTATLRSAKFRQLLDTHARGREVLLQPCPGLAAAIERGQLDHPRLLALIDRFTRPLREAGVDTVVLGCTHYPFVRERIQSALGSGVAVVDTADAVARHTVTRLVGLSPSQPGAIPIQPARVVLQTSGDVALLQRIAERWLAFPTAVASLPAGV